MRKLLGAGCALCSVTVSAASDDSQLTIYGIGLMTTISIPECAAFADVVKWRKKYRTDAYPYAPPAAYRATPRKPV